MRTKSFVLSVILVASAAGVSVGDPADLVKVYARGDYAGVVEALAAKQQAGKANIQERLILARSYLHLNRRDEALAVLKSVLAADKENPEANSLTGRILLDRKQHKEALKYLQHAYRLKQDPATASALGRCHHALGDLAKAKVHLQAALAADIRDPRNSLLLGKICLHRGLGALAEKYLLMAEEAGLASAELYGLLGRAYLMQRKLVGPVQARRLSKPAKPGDVVGEHLVLGRIEGVEARYKVCTRYCALYEGKRLFKAAPGSADARYMLAAGWLAAGDTKLAMEHLKVLVQREPGSRRSAELRVRQLLATKDFAALDQALAGAEAKKVFTPAEISDFYCRAAMALRAEGKRDRAAGLLAKAEALTPTSERVLRPLAALHLAAGRTAQARRTYGRLVELLPDATDIDELRNRLRVLGSKEGGAR